LSEIKAAFAVRFGKSKTLADMLGRIAARKAVREAKEKS